VAETAQGEADRVPPSQADRFAERRDELADVALETLGELGYAHTSLREIAQNSEFSHGVLHYYFTDKTDLITHGVRRYNQRCVRRYDDVLELATDADDLAQHFADAMVATMRGDAAMHRLWYDLRSQAMFEESLQEAVLAIDEALAQMIWRIISRYAELSGTPTTTSRDLTYALFDGAFEQCLLRHLSGDESADASLREYVGQLLRLTHTSPG
jgi:AcrR family transcriptional regulator